MTMTMNERLLKLAVASPTVLAKVDADLNGTDKSARSHDRDCRLITYTEAAKMLRVSRPTVYRLAKGGRLKTVPLAGVNRIVLQSVIDCVDGKGE